MPLIEHRYTQKMVNADDLLYIPPPKGLMNFYFEISILLQRYNTIDHHFQFYDILPHITLFKNRSKCNIN